MIILFCFRYLLGYTEPNTFIVSAIFPSILIDSFIININLAQNFSSWRVIEIIDPTFLFISSSLDFVPKYNRGFWKIHYLSYLKGNFVNNYTTTKAFTLSYTLLQQEFEKVLVTSRHTVLLKQNIRDAFWNILRVIYM